MRLSGSNRLIISGFILATLSQPYLAFGAGQSFSRSGSFRASGVHGQRFFSHSFHRFGFVGVDGLGDQQVTVIQQFQSPPSTEPSEPAKNQIYVPPRWVDGGYGVQLLQPGYWTVPNQAPER